LKGEGRSLSSLYEDACQRIGPFVGKEEHFPVSARIVIQKEVLMNKMLFALVAGALLFSCAPKTEMVTVKPEKIVALENINPADNIGEMCRVTEEGIIHYHNKAEKVTVYKTGFDGNQSEIVQIAKGKGPGEVNYPMAMRLRGDRFLIYDMMMRKSVEYRLDGSYIDEQLVQGDVGFAHSFDVTGDKLLFNGSLQTELAIVDDQGRIEKLIKYKNVQMMPDDGTPFPGGCVRYNAQTNRIVVGYYNAPYRLTFFDEKGEQIMAKEYKMDRKVQPCVWTLEFGMPFPKGDIMVGGGAMYKKWFISSPVGGYDIKDGEFVTNEHPLEFYVFDTLTGEKIQVVKIEGLDSLDSGVVIGTTDDYIFVVATDEALKEKYGLSSDTALLLLSNPLKGREE